MGRIKNRIGEINYNNFGSKMEIIAYRGATDLDIYFEEYTEPFEISNITGKRLDKQSLYRLTGHEILEVYYNEKVSDDDAHSICEMKSEDTVFLSLSDYKAVNQNNQVIGMICSVAFFFSALGCLVHMIKKLKDGGA